MKTRFGWALASAMLLGGMGTASAADMAVKAVRAPPPPIAVYNWTGFYFGVDGGGGWEDIGGNYVLPPVTDRHSSSQTIGLGGGFVGGQYQFGNWVFGAEASGTALDDTWGRSLSPSAACIASTADRTCLDRFRDLWDVGGKIGYAFNRWMVYGTGGYANARLDTQTNVTSTGVITSVSSYRHDGWFAGVGGDVIVANWGMTDLIFGVQYKHYEFDTVRHFANLPGAPIPIVPDGNTRDMSGKLDVVTARLSLKFGAPGAVVAKY